MKRLPIYSANDLHLAGMTMAIIKPIGTDGDIELVEYGRGFVPTSDGIQIIIEEKYALDIEKFKLSMSPSFQPILTLKEGVEWEEPREDSNAKRMQELENELIRLKEEQNNKEEHNIPDDEEEALRRLDEEIANRR